VSAREFAHVVPLQRLGVLPEDHLLSASADERAALARRFGLLAIDRFDAQVSVERLPGGARLLGRLSADVVQSCVVSGEPVPAHLDEALDLRFEPPPAEESDVELDPDALEVVHIEGDAIDIGEAVAQSLALALDPWPRADAETLAKARRLLLSEEEAEALAASEKAAASPFAKLRRE
jgi:uncharacterized metal-binding protein YceD (DUF177 family)